MVRPVALGLSRVAKVLILLKDTTDRVLQDNTDILDQDRILSSREATFLATTAVVAVARRAASWAVFLLVWRAVAVWIASSKLRHGSKCFCECIAKSRWSLLDCPCQE
jgi:hypothetical protein